MKRMLGMLATGVILGPIAFGAMACGDSGGNGSLIGDGNDPGNGNGNGNKPGNGNGNKATDGGTIGSGNGGDAGVDAAPPPPKAPPLAQGITVSEIAVFQGVKVDIVTGGAKVATRKAPVVSKREALIRAYVTPDATFQSKSLTAELHMTVGGADLPVMIDTKTISGASTDGSLASTFNFDVPADNMTTDASYYVAITDPAGGSATGTSGARYPTSGTETLDAKSSGDQLKLLLVPVQYNGDGSGRLPTTDANQVELYRKTMFSMYPAAKIDITVRSSPMPFQGTIDASGNGWDEVLSALQDLRQQDNPPDDVYYFGTFEPDASFGTFCGSGCVVGLSGLASRPADAGVRASVGIGYAGKEAALTMAHEVGHAHGRKHAPCGGAANPDTAFPYTGGGIGVWGYDLNTKTLQDATKAKDLMGYCNPNWISDYNYAALFTRMALVNSVQDFVGAFPSPRPYRYVKVRADGSIDWGRATTLRARPLGEEHTVTYRAADGSTVSTDVGSFYEYDHLPGGYMLVPELPAGATSIIVSGPRVVKQLAR